MTYESVIKNANSEEELEQDMRVFYMDEIGVMLWLDDKSNQTIRFNDAFFYKKAGRLHNLNGPAIDPTPTGLRGTKPIETQYFIDGIKKDFDSWSIESSVIKRKKILGNILESQGED